MPKVAYYADDDDDDVSAYTIISALCQGLQEQSLNDIRETSNMKGDNKVWVNVTFIKYEVYLYTTYTQDYF